MQLPFESVGRCRDADVAIDQTRSFLRDASWSVACGCHAGGPARVTGALFDGQAKKYRCAIGAAWDRGWVATWKPEVWDWRQSLCVSMSSSGPVWGRNCLKLRAFCSSCGPDTRGWCQAVGGEFDPTGSISHQAGSGGGKRNSSPGRARHKPSSHCAGNAGVLRLYLYARVRSLCAICTRDRGCSKHPAFPAPSHV